MNKIANLFFLTCIILFFFNIFKYYHSSANIKKINLNRSNIDKILKSSISNLPILVNDTNNVIVFNSSFLDKTKNNETRSFWNLLKSK
jgi:hypothetical protein|tara:strand:+ start:173 stop:436 length:264 start_codon:yes stop_codon:yes gene_type:complete